MQTYKITAQVSVYQMEELNPEDRLLVEQAIAATEHSYSPYSHFSVGAALRLKNGEVITGSNQENASSSMTICAERNAIFHAQHLHPGQPIVSIAIAARTEKAFTPFPIPPCGACRQVVLEVEDRYKQPIRLLLYGTGGIHVVDTVKDLLPIQFGAENLK